MILRKTLLVVALFFAALSQVPRLTADKTAASLTGLTVGRIGSAWSGLDGGALAAGLPARAIAFSKDGALYLGGGNHAWVMKTASGDHAEVFHSLLGRGVQDAVNALAVDDDGDLHAVGTVWVNGREQGFHATLDSEGKLSAWRPLARPVQAIALAADGEIYLAGDDFVIQEDGWSATPPGPVRALGASADGSLYVAGRSERGAYVSRLSMNASGAAPRWEAPLLQGGTGLPDEARAVAIGPNGDIYAAGVTGSPDFPARAAHQGRLAGASDAWLARIGKSGVEWATYFGGHGSTEANALAFDPQGNPVFAGWTNAWDLPLAGSGTGSGASYFARFSVEGKLIEGAFGPESKPAAMAAAPGGDLYMAGVTVQGKRDPSVSRVDFAAVVTASPYLGDNKRSGAGVTADLYSPKALTATTTTLLVSPGGTATLGDSVTLTTYVTPSAATGRVTFYDGETILGSSPVNGAATSLVTKLLPFGPHSLWVLYPGNSTYAASVSSKTSLNIQANGVVSYQTATGTVSAGNLAYAVTNGDFNGDLKTDMAIANAGSDNVTILLGDGQGGFSQPAGSPVSVGAKPQGIATGDFNQDGKMDLAVASVNGANVSVLLGNGQGGFTAASYSPISVGGVATEVRVGDFNHDGKPDLVVTDQENDKVMVLLNNGAGFSAGVEYAAGVLPHSIAIADFNGDGKADLAIADSTDQILGRTGNTVTILLGNGSGGFSAAPGSPFATGANPQSIVAADFDGDGKLDLATANYDSNNVSFFSGDGAGRFTQMAGSPVKVGTNPISLTLGDFTGDGVMSVAVANFWDGGVTLIKPGPGSFTTSTVSASGPTAVAVGDYNGDGSTDLVIIDSGGGVGVQVAQDGVSKMAFASGPPSTGAAGTALTSFQVLLEDPAGAVYPATNKVTLTSTPTGVSGTLTANAVNGVATFSNVVFNTPGAYTLTAASSGLTSIVSPSITVSAGAPATLSFSTQPSNTATGAAISPSVVVQLKDSLGNLTTSTQAVTITSTPTGVGGATTVNAVSGAATFSNLTFNSPGSYTLTATSASVTAATSHTFTVTSVATKLAFTTQPSGGYTGQALTPAPQVSVLDGAGNVVSSSTAAITIGSTTVNAVAGVATFSDLVFNTTGTRALVATASGLTTATSNSFTISNPPAKLAFSTQPPTTATAGATFSAVVQVQDSTGAVSTGSSAAVTIGSTTVNAVSGVATFSSLVFNTAGSYTLTATSSGLTSAVSNSITINPGAAAKVAFTATPSSGISSQALTPAVTAVIQDAYGNTTTSTAQVTLSSTPTGATGTLTVAAVAGIATFSNVIFNSTGSYTLTAASTGLTSAVSPSFNIGPAGPAKLAFITQPPSTVTAGATFGAAVQIQDANGNLYNASTAAVTIGSTTVNAVAGVATFSNLSITTAGTSTLTAASSGLTSAVSNSITVTPAAASKLAFSTQPPSTATAGTAFGAAVQVQDAYGNPVTTSTAPVTIGSTTLNASAGVATFSNLVLTTAGTVTLTATSSGLTSAVSNQITVSAGAAAKLAFSVQPPPTGTSGTAFGASVQVQDANGNLVTTSTAPVTIGSTTVNASAGVATFSITYNTAGTYTLTAASPGLTSATSTQIVISAAPPAKLAFSVPPGAAASGAAQNVTVQVQDANGNPVTSTASITLTSSPSGYSATQSAVNGVAAFSVTLTAAGSYTLTASSSGLTSATSGAFVISAAAAAKLAITTLPPTATAGSAFTAKVQVQDASGNAVTTSTAPITIGSTTVNAVNGVATFSNLVFTVAGSQTVTATSPGLATATGTLTIYGSTPVSMTFSTPPVDVIAGQFQTVVVSLLDVYGNTASPIGYPAVTLTSTPSGLTGLGTKNAPFGTASFINLYSNSTGTYTLTATSSGLPSVTSNSFSITPGPASKLVFTTQPPSSVSLGAPFSAVVQVQDSKGNLVTTSTAAVTIGSSTVNAVGGVATFNNLVLSSTGVSTVTATSSGLNSATSTSITVNPPTPTRVVFTTQPSNGTAGQALSPTVVVKIEDDYGNVANSSATVVITSTPPGVAGNLSARASSGVASFPTLTFATAGAYTLTATSGSLASATSVSFNIVAGSGNKLVFTTQPPAGATAGAAFGVVVQVQDANGNLVTGSTAPVTIGSTTVNASGGVATFPNLVLNTAGTYSLTATSSGLTNAVSTPIVVTPAAASKLMFSTPPNSGTAGQALTPAVVITISDPYGNAVDSSDAVTLASTPAGVSGTLSVNAVHGVATFPDLTFTDDNNYTLTASASGLPDAVSNQFTILPGAGASLVFTTQPPASAAAGATFSAVVQIQDANGNVATQSTAQVTIGAVSVKAVAGVATFPNLSISTAGTYTLIATSSGLANAVSTPIAIVPAAAAQLVFTTQPSSGTAGQPITPAPVVSIQDNFGNVVNSTAAVTIGSITVNAVAGVASFPNIVITTSGNYTLTASASGFANVTSNQFTITPGSGSTMSFSTQPPASATAGASFSAVVQILDSNGNVATGSSAQVTIGSTTVNAVSGVATFSSLSLTTAGTYTLTATSSGLANAISTPITINPAAAKKLAFTTQPVSGTAGQALTPAPAVSIQDNYGNTVNSSASVKIGSTTVSAVAGVATFPNVVFTATGNYTLTATSTGLTNAVSNQFTISAGSGSKLVFTTQPPASATAGATFSAVVAIQDSNGNVVTGSTAQVTIGSTSVSAVAGVATFSTLSFATVGTYTLTATSTGLANATSNSITISAGAAAQLAFTTQPSSGTAGQALSPAPVVAVQDAYGNLVSSAAAVTIGSTTVNAIAGSAKFSNLVFSTAGNYTLTATASGLTSAVSNAFTISAGTGKKLVFTTQPPTTGIAGVAFGAVVQVQDANGNLVTSSSARVTIGSLSVFASGGVATFTNLVLTTAGSYTLTATSTGLTSATSSSITIVGGDASQLAFTVQPTSTTAGSALSPAPKVTVLDAYGNPVNSAAVITIDPVSVTASNGVATFSNLALTTAGTYTLTATSPGLASAVSNSFTISPATAYQLGFSTEPPSSVTAGASFGASVQVQDRYGNLVSSASKSITIGSTSRTTVSGVATFTNLQLTTAGVYTLTATASAVTSAVSTPVTVTPALAAKLAFTVQPTSGTAGDALSPAPTVAIQDTYGNLVASTSGVTMGGATVNAVAGVATFPNLVYTTAGTFTLTATSPGLTSAVSNQFTITAASGSKLAFSTQPPASKTAGATFSAVVQVQDSNGNVVAGSTAAITIGSTTVNAVAGVATFSSLSIATAGAYTLTATSPGLSNAVSTSITITAATASKLVFTTQPGSGTAGQPLSPAPVVQVQDAYGNLTKSTVSVTAGTSTVTSVSGVATFSNVVFTTAGNYTLTASSSGLASAVSDPFTISPGNGSKLAFTTQPPATGTAGVAFGAVVQIQDSNGNLVSGSTAQVTIGSTSVNAVGGVATFNNLVYTTVGSYRLTATASGFTSATSTRITIDAAQASQLAFTTQPASGTAGQSLSPAPVVQIQDAFGNLVNATAAVTIGSTTVNAVAGVATFPNLVFNTAGNYTLTAASPGLASAVSNPFTISASTGASLAFSTQPPASGTAGSPFTAVVQVQDSNGNVVTGSTAQITIGSTTLNAVAGVATFSNLVFNAAGVYTLTATSTGLGSAVSTSITIGAAAPSQLVFTTQPGSGTAGQALSPAPAVTIEDAFGNVVNSTAPVTIDQTTVNAVAGVATFSNYVLNTAGDYTLTATSPGLLSDTSDPFTISAGNGSKLVFSTQPPSTGTAGVTFSAVVQIQDANGNVVTGSTAQVTIGAASVNAVAGVATFSSLVFNTAGTYILTTTSSGLTSAASTPITIGAASASQLVFTTQPTSGTAGQALSPAPAVTIKDAFGNVVASTSAVTIGSTTVNAVAGVAAFPNLVFNTAGNYTLTATSPSLISATSNQFTITAASGSKLTFTTQPPATGVAGVPFGAVVQVQDSNGNLVTGSTAQVTIGATTVNAVAGVATFSNLVLNTAGAYTLTAASSGFTSAVSTSITIAAASASQLAFSTQPASGTAGQALSPAPAVTIKDSFGNTVASTAAVTIGSTTVNAVAGVAVFPNLVFNTAGNYTLTATSPGLTSATSNQFTITAASGSKLAFTTQPPSTGTAGAPFGAVVQVQDSNGNLVTGSTAQVTIGSTTVNAVGGVATFSNLVYNTAGTYTLTASSSGFTSVASTSITIAAAAANRLAFTIQPTSGTAGQSLSPAPAVAIKDSFGNTVASTAAVTIGSTTVNAVAGVAVFPNLVFNTAGAYTLIAASPGLTSATSNQFTVTAASGSKMVFTTQPPVTATAGVPFSAVVQVQDSNGNVVNSTAAVSIGSTTVNAVAGVAAFPSLSFNVVGAYSLTATSPGLATATSRQFTITAASASKLAFVTQPPPAGTAGQVLSPAPVVAVRDNFGNVVDSTAPITIGATTVTAVAGVAAFPSIVFSTPGTYTLTASSPGFASITSNQFSINAASGNRLVFSTQPPATGTAGVTFTAIVQLQDPSGNIINSSAPVTIPGFTVNAIGGVAAFTKLGYNTAGTYVLTATASGFANATSTPITINPAAPSSMAVVSGNSQSATVTAAFAAPLVVKLTDPFGNAVPNKPVAFSVVSNRGASASLSASSAVTDSAGRASVTATANGVADGYTVTASTGSITTSFALANTAGQATVSSVTAVTANGAYGTGAVITIAVHFTAPVTVTGTPQLALNSGGVASYAGGGGTSALLFAYVVGAGQTSAHLDYASANALSLNGGAIGAGMAALALPAPTAAGSLGANSAIVIDATSLAVTSVEALFGGQSYKLAAGGRSRLPWLITGVRVTFNRPVAAAQAASLGGVVAAGPSGVGTNTLTWTTTALPSGAYTLTLAGSGAAAIQDAAGNALGAGAGFSQLIKILVADYNDDGAVNAADQTGVNLARGSAYDLFADINGDGAVDLTDVQLVRARMGSTLN